MKLYHIDDIVEGIFIERPNRYLAEVDIAGKRSVVHVHDPGRLKELLYLGNRCLVKYAASEKRKTEWDMIAAYKDDEFVLVHSGIHRYLAEAILRNADINPFGGFEQIKPEAKYGKSRIDFLAKTLQTGEDIWVEVKGCSLSIDGIAKFPDAPTERGTRHLEELIEIKASGARAGVLLLVLSNARAFIPNKETDPKFYKTFYKALAAGVEIKPVRIALNHAGDFIYMGEIEILEGENE